MEYSITALSKLAGISTRTLRYYDEIGLLKPQRTNSSNYRIYGQKEVDLLQQILFYRELDLPLDTIRSIVHNKDFDSICALHEHKDNLLQKQKQIETLLKNIDKTLLSLEGGIEMSDQEKFEGFKKELLEQNEEKYGKEIREKYGEDSVQEGYKKFSSFSETEFNEASQLDSELIKKLKEAMATGNPSSETAHAVAELHKKWLSYYGKYSPEAHIGLGQMYVADERFTKYYDEKAGDGAAQFLYEAIQAYYK